MRQASGWMKLMVVAMGIGAGIAGYAYWNENLTTGHSSHVASVAGKAKTDRHIASKTLARPLHAKAQPVVAPDFVREAWARDAARRNTERTVAGAFETRFVTAKVPAGALTSEKLAELFKAKDAAASENVELASLEPNQAVSALEALADHDGETGDEAADIASLGADLPDAGLVPGWRPQLARVKAKPAQKPAAPNDAVVTMAYARPDSPIEKPAAKSAAIPWPNMGRKTAVYDVTNAVVHMPNGQKLEAHSGRGKMRDNPKYSHVKMRGSTPASTYRLSMRESLFHGVEAIRLNPISGKAPKNRTGLLAHTYLLRVPGDSSGCVVFKHYDKFLAAFKRGEITHMVVVDELESAPAPRLASFFSSRS